MGLVQFSAPGLCGKQATPSPAKALQQEGGLCTGSDEKKCVATEKYFQFVGQAVHQFKYPERSRWLLNNFSKHLPSPPFPLSSFPGQPIVMYRFYKIYGLIKIIINFSEDLTDGDALKIKGHLR
ncbi:hypothetical protein [Rufibacter ruber]|uniref:hypothetical protein n=1 Tax=Rufibacter ruber TaxID=1783499 RepID=UPI0008321D14|nr:hypothetical protein [Rufibacter ruber]